MVPGVLIRAVIRDDQGMTVVLNVWGLYGRGSVYLWVIDRRMFCFSCTIRTREDVRFERA